METETPMQVRDYSWPRGSKEWRYSKLLTASNRLIGLCITNIGSPFAKRLFISRVELLKKRPFAEYSARKVSGVRPKFSFTPEELQGKAS